MNCFTPAEPLEPFRALLHNGNPTRRHGLCRFARSGTPARGVTVFAGQSTRCKTGCDVSAAALNSNTTFPLLAPSQLFLLLAFRPFIRRTAIEARQVGA